MKPVVLAPSGFYIDFQRAILNAPDILLNRAHVPRKKEAVFEEGGRDGRAQKDAKVGDETM
ncbi:MAG: hypothetical protein NTAFB01_14420 [Nitrospira sp.]